MSEQRNVSAASPSPGDAWIIVQDGITYVEADAVRRWIEVADPELARKWQGNVDHMARVGVERVSEASKLSPLAKALKVARGLKESA